MRMLHPDAQITRSERIWWWTRVLSGFVLYLAVTLGLCAFAHIL